MEHTPGTQEALQNLNTELNIFGWIPTDHDEWLRTAETHPRFMIGEIVVAARFIRIQKDEFKHVLRVVEISSMELDHLTPEIDGKTVIEKSMRPRAIFSPHLTGELIEVYLPIWMGEPDPRDPLWFTAAFQRVDEGQLVKAVAVPLDVPTKSPSVAAVELMAPAGNDENDAAQYILPASFFIFKNPM